MDCPLYIDRVPKCDCGRDERETARPVALLLEATISDFTEPAEKDCSCECVPSLAFVEARVNAAAEFDALQPGENEERPFDTAQFSQGDSKSVLARVAAQLAKHERSCDGALLD